MTLRYPAQQGSWILSILLVLTALLPGGIVALLAGGLLRRHWGRRLGGLPRRRRLTQRFRQPVRWIR